MRVMYQYDLRKISLTDIFSELETKDYSQDTIQWAENITNLAEEHLSNIDTIIHDYTIDWNIDRLSYVDKALLRIGISEIIYTDTPFQVVVNEIIELSKTNYRLLIGPFNDIKSLRNNFEKMDLFNFENLEVLKNV